MGVMSAGGPTLSSNAADAPMPSAGVNVQSTPRRAWAGSGRNVNYWAVDIQAEKGRKGSCTKCKENFIPGEVRIFPATEGTVSRRFHITCLDADLPPSDAFQDHDLLDEAQKAVFENLLAAEKQVVDASRKP